MYECLRMEVVLSHTPPTHPSIGGTLTINSKLIVGFFHNWNDNNNNNIWDVSSIYGFGFFHLVAFINTRLLAQGSFLPPLSSLSLYPSLFLSLSIPAQKERQPLQINCIWLTLRLLLFFRPPNQHHHHHHPAATNQLESPDRCLLIPITMRSFIRGRDREDSRWGRGARPVIYNRHKTPPPLLSTCILTSHIQYLFS